MKLKTTHIYTLTLPRLCFMGKNFSQILHNLTIAANHKCASNESKASLLSTGIAKLKNIEKCKSLFGLTFPTFEQKKSLRKIRTKAINITRCQGELKVKIGN